MSFVPVYGTVSDNVSDNEGHTSSRRGKVTGVRAEINTHFGRAIVVDVDSDGSLDRKDEQYALDRVLYFKNKGNIKKVTFWEEKLRDYQGYNKIQDLKEKCDVTIDFSGVGSENYQKFNYLFRIAGSRFSLTPQNLIEVALYWNEFKNILPQLKVAKALQDGNNGNK